MSKTALVALYAEQQQRLVEERLVDAERAKMKAIWDEELQHELEFQKVVNGGDAIVRDALMSTSPHASHSMPSTGDSTDALSTDTASERTSL